MGSMGLEMVRGGGFESHGGCEGLGEGVGGEGCFQAAQKFLHAKLDYRKYELEETRRNRYWVSV